MTTMLNSTLRAIASSLQYPVIIILIILAICVLILLGATICEYFTERRHQRAVLPVLIDEIYHSDNIPETLKNSALIKRQKKALLEITQHPDLPPDSRTALAIRLVDGEETFYNGRVKKSDLIARIAPMFGLLGTLIPLGPGIIALGQGDTYTLSLSLLTAFDTTVVGLIVAAIAVVISTVRKRWYEGYMADIRALMENTLEAAENNPASCVCTEDTKSEIEEDGEASANAEESVDQENSSEQSSKEVDSKEEKKEDPKS